MSSERWLRAVTILGIALPIFVAAGCLHGNSLIRGTVDKDDAPDSRRVALAQYEQYEEYVEEHSASRPLTEEPRRISHPRDDETWEIKLADIFRIALSSNAIIRNRGDFLSSANSLLANPDQTLSIFDPAIQESGGPFGGQGVDAALARFDPEFSSNVSWGRQAAAQNNRFLSGGLVPGAILSDEAVLFGLRLEKQLKTGGRLSIGHGWDYSSNNVPSRLYNSVYVGELGAEYRHPLWGGAGREFTEIAGPHSYGFGSGRVDAGILIARINNDISQADFELKMQGVLKEVEELYWELYLDYRVYESQVSARDDANQIWKKVKIRVEAGFEEIGAADEAYARQNYLQRKLRADDALANLYETEARLRRLIGLPVNDGRIMRPIDPPLTSQFDPNWETSLQESLSNRIELHKQQSRIRSLSLQLKAAKSLTRPSLEFVTGYQVNAFGNNLFRGDNSANTTFGSGYKSLLRTDQTGWNVGLELDMPIGFRKSKSQVRNIELRLAKAAAALAAQELEISHELAAVFRRLDRFHEALQTSEEIRVAADLRVQAIEADYNAGRANLDLLLRSRIDLIEAKIRSHRSVVAYNQAVMEYYFRIGGLLDRDNVEIGDGAWNADRPQDGFMEADEHSP